MTLREPKSVQSCSPNWVSRIERMSRSDSAASCGRSCEEASAWIRLKPGARLTEDDVKAFCRGRIAHYKVPRYIAFVEEYPTTVTGKVQKFKLREMGIERFALGSARMETA